MSPKAMFLVGLLLLIPTVALLLFSLSRYL